MSQALRDQAAAGFETRFGTRPTVVVSAPGRVNLLGGHVDYNDGCVMPVAIDRAIAIAAAPTDNESIELFSDNFSSDSHFQLSDIERTADWTDYPKGIIQAHVRRGDPIGGFRAYFLSDLPMGGGVSSSAAVDVAVSAVLQRLFGFTLPGAEVARLAQEADHAFVGIRCGIMDQFASAMCRANHVLHLDCRSLAFTHVPIDLERYRVVVIQSGVQRALVNSEYNARRAECERGVDLIRTRHGTVRALRDVDPAMLEACRDLLPDTTYKRCRHVVDEIARVEAGVAALRARDMATFGDLIYASHASSRDWYEVSCPELDTLVEAGQAAPGNIAARVTGAGFGGCTAHLIEADEVSTALAHVRATFAARFGREPDALVCQSGDGAFATETHA